MIYITNKLCSGRLSSRDCVRGDISPEAEIMFEFEKSELTLEIEESVTPGWSITPAMKPCTVCLSLL